MSYTVKIGEFFPMGVAKENGWVNFCFEARRESVCKILIYDREKPEVVEEILVPMEFAKGNLRAVKVQQLEIEKKAYVFEIDGDPVLDFYARGIAGREIWADENRKQSPKDGLRCRYVDIPFSWKTDVAVEIPRTEMFLYKLHVRGFTMGLEDAGVSKGTFKALEKKLSYLKSLGVTSVELMPVYEFEEWVTEPTYKINFWGYGDGFYYAPKASYAASGCPEIELKECILQMHKKGMECILEMNFPNTISVIQILDILKYWVREYHVDGFHLQGNAIPIDVLIEDAYLGRTKLFYRDIPEHLVEKAEKKYPRLFVYRDDFLYPTRKLLNGYNGNIWEYADQMRKQNEKVGFINYLADNNGFTLADLFAYEAKHNADNGEENADGMQWNFSSNCGVEGETNSRNVIKHRERCMRNAVTMLFAAQGVPMLMAGDEDCNSQKGNNNAYCQDNEIGWKDWSQTKLSKDFVKFVKKLIAFRKEHEILRLERPLEFTDTLACGYPELSYHEESAWISPQHINRRALGVLFCGGCVKEAEDVYVGMNFADFMKELALPKQKNGKKWYVVMRTDDKKGFLSQPEEIEGTTYGLESHSICIIVGKNRQEK